MSSFLNLEKCVFSKSFGKNEARSGLCKSQFSQQICHCRKKQRKIAKIKDFELGKMSITKQKADKIQLLNNSS